MSKRKILTITEKISFLKEVKNVAQKKCVMEKFKIPSSTVSTIIKNRDTILKSAEILEEENG